MTANEVAAWSRRRSRLPRSAKEEASLGKLRAGTCEQEGGFVWSAPVWWHNHDPAFHAMGGASEGDGGAGWALLFAALSTCSRAASSVNAIEVLDYDVPSREELEKQQIELLEAASDRTRTRFGLRCSQATGALDLQRKEEEQNRVL